MRRDYLNIMTDALCDDYETTNSMNGEGNEEIIDQINDNNNIDLFFSSNTYDKLVNEMNSG